MARSSMPAARRPAPPRGRCCGLDGPMSGGWFHGGLMVVAGLAGLVAVAGGSTAAADGVAGTSSPSIVLRGSIPLPTAAAQASPAAEPACPAGYIPDSSAGCVPSGNAFEPYDYDWLLAYPLLEARQQPARRF